MDVGMPEMIFIFLLALVMFGPKKLPELGRQLGKILGEFKKASNEFKNQLEVEMMNIELEERSRPTPEASRTILPAEKLFDTVSVPPMESIPRGPIPALGEPTSVAGASGGESATPETVPVTPDVPSQNA